MKAAILNGYHQEVVIQDTLTCFRMLMTLPSGKRLIQRKWKSPSSPNAGREKN